MTCRNKEERAETMICEQKQSFSWGRKSLSSDSHHPIGEEVLSLLSSASFSKRKIKGCKFCSKENARWILGMFPACWGLRECKVLEEGGGGFGGAVKQADLGTVGYC